MGETQPQGLTFKIWRRPDDYKMEVTDATGWPVADMQWWGAEHERSQNKIKWIEVKEPYRRRGIATEMLRRAREVTPDLKHSDDLSEDAKAWSQRTAAREVYYHGTSHRLSVGETLRPGAAPTNWNNGGTVAASSVWLTDDPSDARRWAVDGARSLQMRETGVWDPAEPEVYVYEVRPVGEPREWEAPNPYVRHFTVPEAVVTGEVKDRRIAAGQAVYYHVTSYANWPSIRDTGLRPTEGHVWLFTNAEAAMRFKDAWGGNAWREGVPPEQWKVPPCIVVVRTDRAVPTEAGIPGAYWVEGPVAKDEIYDVIRPEDMHHYAGARGGLPEGLTFRLQEYPNPEAKRIITEIDGQYVGELAWFGSGQRYPEIQNVEVKEPYRRMGIATEMLRRAREIDPNLYHSADLSEDGRAWKNSVGSKTASPEHAGDVMVCLRPPEDVCKAIASMEEFTEDPDEIHLTLYYLGEIGDEAGDAAAKERLLRGLYAFSLNAGYRGLTGVLNGMGCFQNDEGDYLIGLWDIPGIAEFRTHIDTYLKEHGYIRRQDDHGFTPHSTISTKSFSGPLPRVPEELRGEKVVFGSVWLVWGEEWTEVTLP